MATVVLAAAGSAAGTALGGSMLGILGGMVGAAVGGSVDRSLFGSSHKVEGPRLTDLAVQASTYGVAVPLVYGTARVAGNIIWSTGLTELRNESSSGGGKGGGGGGVTQVAYSYSACFAVALSGRPIDRVGRIWADGKLLRDATGRLAVPGEMRVYPGHEAQLPDPLIEAVEGAANVSAHRGLAYVVFEDLQLAEYANRIPNLTFEVVADAQGDAALSMLVMDLAGRAGLRAIDAAPLDGRVAGFVVARVGAVRQALEALAAVHDFDVTDVDGTLRFVSRPGPVVASIPADDLGVGGTNRRMERQRRQDVDLPAEVCVRYIDPDRDYQIGAQRARRSGDATTRRIVDVPLVLPPTAAKRAAERQLARAWQTRDGYRLDLLPRHVGLTPGDVVHVSEEGRLYNLRIDRTMLGDGLRCEATAERAGTYQSGAAADGGQFTGQSVADSGETTLVLMNLPSVATADQTAATVYAAAAGAADGWRGAVLYQSVDGEVSYEQAAVLPVAATIGRVNTVLAPGQSATWDEASSLNVTLLRADMALESRSELTVLNGANAALVGGEIVQFRNAVLEGDGSYTLSGLLRGRRGTEWAMAGHAAGEDFVLLVAGGLRSIEFGLGALDKPYRYKPVSANATLAETEGQTFAYSGLNLRPLSPVHATGARDGDGALSIGWVRRTRIGGEWTDGADVPLGEESERYDIDILSGGSVVRTITATAPTASYDATQQIADFGACQALVSLRIHQISAAVGRGFPLDAIL
jgi:hypothetical protein